MPQSIGDDELKLKQRARRRLIGAIALLAALVLILPMVLDKEPKRPSNEISVHIPTAQQTPTNPELAPREPEPKPEPTPAPPAETVAANPPPTAPSATENPPVAAADTPAKPSSEAGFFVQVGVFSKAENAKSIQTKLVREKLPAFSEKIKTSTGQRIRVRVGPFADRDEADHALVRVKRAGEKNAVVIKAEAAR